MVGERNDSQAQSNVCFYSIDFRCPHRKKPTAAFMLAANRSNQTTPTKLALGCSAVHENMSEQVCGSVESFPFSSLSSRDG